MVPAKTPRAILSFFNAPSSTAVAPALASPVDAPVPLPALPLSALPVVIEAVGLDGDADDALTAKAIGTVAALAVRLAPPLSDESFFD
jgi:hypothetical protein